MKHDDEIIKLWDLGLTATEIGATIGKTRAAVLGRINRLRAHGVEIKRKALAPTTPKTHRAKPRKARPKISGQYVLLFDTAPALKPEPFPPTLIVPQTSALDLFDLRQNDCRYVVGYSAKGALYCAQPSHRRQMCRAHYDLCYIRIKA